MPNATIWIRVDDVAKWEAIENKSEWISERLNNTQTLLPITSKRIKLDKPMAFTDDTTIAGDVLNETVTIDNGIESQTLSTKNYCEHGQIKGECLAKGCKYGRGK